MEASRGDAPTPDERTALLVVDVQNDFCPGGALPAPGGDRVVAPLNRRLARAAADGMTVFASRDWHPAVTTHFAPYGGPWPVHCVAGTPGAAFHRDLALPPDVIVISKGEDPGAHGYSAFDGRTADGTPLLDAVRARGVTHLVVGGLTTEYCVQSSVLDALAAGLRVTVLGDAIAGVDVQPGDAARAIETMRARGVPFSER